MKKVNLSIRALAVTLSAVALIACGEARDTNLQDNIQTDEGFFARFDPANSVIPFPNNLLITDYDNRTMNIPVADATDYSDPSVAMNALDGFSTTAPMSASFSTAIDSASVDGSSVRVFEVQITSIEVTASVWLPFVTSVTSELAYGVDFLPVISSVDSSSKTLSIIPLKPLKPNTGYVVALTNSLQGANGENAVPEIFYGLAKRDTPVSSGGKSLVPAMSDAQASKFEGIRLVTNAAEAAVETYTVSADAGDLITDLAASDIVLSWSFTTQSNGDVLSDVYNSVQTGAAATVALASAGTTSPGGAADIYYGTLDVPYYLTAAASPQDTAPLTSFWQTSGNEHVSRLNPKPEATGTQTIPVLASIPKDAVASKPASGWPVVIFQHGVTGNRSHMLAVADSFAQVGFAVVAIDLPLHGLTGNETDGTEALRIASIERLFDLDLVTQDATGAITAQAPDGVIDSSGRHFINLTSLLTSRDNVRQAVSDLFVLTKALPDIDFDGVAGGDFDANKIYFTGHSLGGIVGTVFLAKESNVKDAILAMTGGGIPKLLDGSPAFGSEIAAGLAANGVNRGTPDYEKFMLAAQTVLDSADPLNYAADAATGRGVLLFEVVGDDTHVPDQVIPNNIWPSASNGAVPSPLAGTTPLGNAMGLTQVSTTTNGTDLTAWVRFSAGHHGSLLTTNDALGQTDTDSLAVFSEMQSQMAGFIVNDGGKVSISDTNVIVTP